MARKIIPKNSALRKADPLALAVRNTKIRYIAQSHVLPGLSLAVWREIMARHGVDLKLTNPWPQVSDQTLDDLLAELRGDGL